MNKTDFIDAMLASGMTPQDIFDLAQTRTRNKKFETARNKFIQALIEYVQVIAPDIEVDDDTIEDVKNALIENEEWASKCKKLAANKRSDDDIIKDFLNSLGI